MDRVQDAVPRCNGLTFRMSLEDLKKKVIFHNSVDVWIAACNEKSTDWADSDKYRRFISYLLSNGLNLKAFNLCAHEAGATDESKTSFTEELAHSNDPNSKNYTIRLTDNTIKAIRDYDF